MGTKVKFQLTPDIHMFDPTRPCDNQVRYQVYILLKHVKKTRNPPHFINRCFSGHQMSLENFVFNDRFNKKYACGVYCTDFAQC